jgi:Winged helix-turn helix
MARSVVTSVELQGPPTATVPGRLGHRRPGPAQRTAGVRVATDLWTLVRMTAVIERLIGSASILSTCGPWLRALGWSPHGPRRAIQRDEAEIATWREQEWLRIKGGTEAGAWLCFLDESSVSLIPPVRRTWPSRADPATPGPLAARVHGGMCCIQPDRSQALLCFHTQPGSYNDHSLIDGLQQLRRFLRTGHRDLGQPAVHRSRVMGEWPTSATGCSRIPARLRPRPGLGGGAVGQPERGGVTVPDRRGVLPPP